MSAVILRRRVPAGTRFVASLVALLVGLMAPDLAAAEGGAPAAAALPDRETPLDWVYPAPEPLRVHVVRGLWSREYRLEEALARGGTGLLTASWHGQGMGFGYVGGWDPNVGGSVPEFPEPAEELLANHVVIVCNVNAKAFTPGQQQLLASFVQHGGGLLFLGGRFAFGSQWRQTPLAAVAPVTFVDQGFDLKCFEPGLPLAAGPARLGEPPAAIRWDAAPRVFWLHEVKPKPEAQVTVVADGRPLLIAGTYGQGRVALFAGSVMGEPPAGSLPFWAWDDWPRLLAETISWLAATRARQNGVLGAEARGNLTRALGKVAAEAEAREGQAALAAIEPLLMRASRLLRRDPDGARLVVQTLAEGEADPAPALAELLGRRLAAAVGEQGPTIAAKLTASGQPGKTALGLRLLGVGPAANATATLTRFLVSGEVEKPPEEEPGEGGTLGVGAMSSATPQQQAAQAVALRLAALEGLSCRRDPQALAAIRKVVKANEAAGRFDRITGDQGKEAYLIPPETRLYQIGLLAALAAGDADAAGPLAEALLGNVYVVSRARTGWNGPKEGTGGGIGALPYVLAWEIAVLELLQQCPSERLVPLAAPLAAINDVRVVPAVLAAFGGRPLSPAVKAALRPSRVKAVAVLGE